MEQKKCPDGSRIVIQRNFYRGKGKTRGWKLTYDHYGPNGDWQTTQHGLELSSGHPCSSCYGYGWWPSEWIAVKPEEVNLVGESDICRDCGSSTEMPFIVPIMDGKHLQVDKLDKNPPWVSEDFASTFEDFKEILQCAES